MSATHQMSWGPLIRSEGELASWFRQLEQRRSQCHFTSMDTDKQPLGKMEIVGFY